MIKRVSFILFLFLFINNVQSMEHTMILKLKGKINDFVTKSTEKAINDKYV